MNLRNYGFFGEGVIDGICDVGKRPIASKIPFLDLSYSSGVRYNSAQYREGSGGGTGSRNLDDVANFDPQTHWTKGMPFPSPHSRRLDQSRYASYKRPTLDNDVTGSD